MESHPSVGVVLYHSGLDAFIIVRQFRPAVWVACSRQAAAAGLPPPPLEAGERLQAPPAARRAPLGACRRSWPSSWRLI